MPKVKNAVYFASLPKKVRVATLRRRWRTILPTKTRRRLLRALKLDLKHWSGELRLARFNPERRAECEDQIHRVNSMIGRVYAMTPKSLIPDPTA